MKYLLLTTASAVLTLLAPFTFAAEFPAPAAIAAEHSVSTGSSVLMAQDDHGTDQRARMYAGSKDRGQFQVATDSDGRQGDRVPGTVS